MSDGAMSVAEHPSGRGWVARTRDDEIHMILTLDLTDAAFNPKDLAPLQALMEQGHWRKIGFETSQMGRLGTSVLAFLGALRSMAMGRNIAFDETGLPAPARTMLKLMPITAAAAGAPQRRPGVIQRLGQSVIDTGREALESTRLVGEVILRSGAALRGRARLRVVDLLNCLTEAGAGALPVVALVNVLIGGIIAFVGAVELRRFGADIYVADLIGVSEVRELAPVMTAIVMSGRTGSAYAAQIATMQGTEELDALRVIGISIQDYLVLPRVVALSMMMPLLYLYAAALGILGGFCVAIFMSHLSPQMFAAQVEAAVTIPEVFFGIGKSFAFGAWVAISGCRIGLAAGRSANDVGHAATTASVHGIVGVIVIDAICAVCADALGF